MHQSCNRVAEDLPGMAYRSFDDLGRSPELGQSHLSHLSGPAWDIVWYVYMRPFSAAQIEKRPDTGNLRHSRDVHECRAAALSSLCFSSASESRSGAKENAPWAY